jgi:hypothetical protein
MVVVTPAFAALDGLKGWLVTLARVAAQLALVLAVVLPRLGYAVLDCDLAVLGFFHCFAP